MALIILDYIVGLFVQLIAFLMILMFGSTVLELSMSDNSKSSSLSTFDGSRKDINTAIEKICDFMGKFFSY